MMTPLPIATPLLPHRRLSAQFSKQRSVKLESSQPAGSFQLRGIGLICQRAGATHFAGPCGSNAGFAAAVAGLGLHKRQAWGKLSAHPN